MPVKRRTPAYPVREGGGKAATDTTGLKPPIIPDPNRRKPFCKQLSICPTLGAKKGKRLAPLLRKRMRLKSGHLGIIEEATSNSNFSGRRKGGVSAYKKVIFSAETKKGGNLKEMNRLPRGKKRTRKAVKPCRTKL